MCYSHQIWNKIIFFKVRKNLCDRGSGCCGTGFISDFIIWNFLTYILKYFLLNVYFFQQSFHDIFHRDAHFRKWNLHRYQKITKFARGQCFLFHLCKSDQCWCWWYFFSVQEWMTTSMSSMTQETTAKRIGTTGTWSVG